MIGKVAAACAALLVLAPHAAQGQGMGSLQAGMPLRDADYPGVIRLAIDARDVSRAILRGTMTLPVTGPGPMTIYFPRWVPGHHAPSGPIARIAGLTVHAEGTRIGWKRDPVMMHAIHIDVPEGTDTIELGFQYLSPTDPKMGRIEVSPAMIDLQWTSLAPYPAGYPSRRMTVQASVRLPDAWQFATALTTDSVADGVIRFKPVDYETLVDSPILAGRYSARYKLEESKAPVGLAVFADRPELLAATPAQIEAHRRLVDQSLKLFGSRHYDHYDFLLGLTERIGSLGAEHSRSSENFTVPDYFTDWAGTAPSRELLPHEFVHSWNGKFRRGADLLTPTLDTPMQNSLLWVYEGLTRYLGAVLSVRSGLHSLQEGLDNFALSAATMQNRTGRQWRPLLDTTNHSIYAEGAQPWPNWQRGADYYLEGQLIWLDVDTRIRALSGGKRSLDDFVRAFFSIDDGSYRPVPYVFDDVVAGLNAIAPWDWARYFHDRVDEVAPDAPLDGLARGGYRLVYTDTPTGFFRSGETQRGVTDLSWSIGLTADKGGTITDVIWDGPAFAAALTIGTQILAVDGRTYEPGHLDQAVRACKGRTDPLTLTVRRADAVRDVRVACTMGLRYPRLERDPSAPARLDAIFAPRR
ncbi:peptidase M61 [Sphingomonas histidinilytica]|jgi:predicted metalloprotease with PDZ domain|uniref:Predicted metalloprotease, contains C-terminal PDZ domain n=1 Tax=Rhizorhabdus histidinilytica TaxID=439228 RepID=A0A1T4ZUF7_9SPHN|nr:PDZ domain-containing protein [Rhizorhabdus histidinilytica]MBO9377613.1 peptidase M61 [Rhizorhabdus histidinilytica]SKB25963.1 Predicted metalloprotease, contains C-terminal PDZ domain [Rhizorhabdus histidinilytica]